MKRNHTLFRKNSRSGFYTLAQTAALFMVALTLGNNLNAQEHVDINMVLIGSTSTTADFDIVLTNDGTTELKFNAIVIRANNAPISSITTPGSTISAIALNNNPDPAWNINGTAPNIVSNMSYLQNGTAFKLNENTNSTSFIPTARPNLPAGVPVTIGRYRLVVNGGTWIPNSQLGFVWHSTAGVVCESDGVLTNFNNSNIRTLRVSAIQSLNVTSSDGNLGIAPNNKLDDKFTFETAVYPNPFDDVIYLELNSDDTNSPVTINVYNAMGMLLDSKDMNLKKDRTIELGLDYAPGVYQVYVTQNELVKISRIVKR
jgi:hypothetical protein